MAISATGRHGHRVVTGAQRSPRVSPQISGHVPGEPRHGIGHGRHARGNHLARPTGCCGQSARHGLRAACSSPTSSAVSKRSITWPTSPTAAGAADKVVLGRSDPISLGLLKRPGDYGAYDIVVAEGQSLGTPAVVRRALPGHHGLPRAAGAAHAGPHLRANGRSSRPALLGAHAANSRATHPPRESHEQHLHEPGTVLAASDGLPPGKRHWDRRGAAAETAELPRCKSALRRRAADRRVRRLSLAFAAADVQGVRRARQGSRQDVRRSSWPSGRCDRRLSTLACRWLTLVSRVGRLSVGVRHRKAHPPRDRQL